MYYHLADKSSLNTYLWSLNSYYRTSDPLLLRLSPPNLADRRSTIDLIHRDYHRQRSHIHLMIERENRPHGLHRSWYSPVIFISHHLEHHVNIPRDSEASMVEGGFSLPNLSCLIQGFEWRWNGWYTRNQFQAGLYQSPWSGYHLGFTV